MVLHIAVTCLEIDIMLSNMIPILSIDDGLMSTLSMVKLDSLFCF